MQTETFSTHGARYGAGHELVSIAKDHPDKKGPDKKATSDHREEEKVFDGYKGANADYPRKYVRSCLEDAYKRKQYRVPTKEYDKTCAGLGAKPNSHVQSTLANSSGVAYTSGEVLGGETITLRPTYVGEKGFIALLPLLNLNTKWKILDASNNGLRNEAILHLVDMLLRPAHSSRNLSIDLSRNPISDGAGKALYELVKHHPGIECLNLAMTKVPRHQRERIKAEIERAQKVREQADRLAAEQAAAEAEAAELASKKGGKSARNAAATPRSPSPKAASPAPQSPTKAGSPTPQSPGRTGSATTPPP